MNSTISILKVVTFGLIIHGLGTNQLIAAESAGTKAASAASTFAAGDAKARDFPRGCSTPVGDRKVETGCYTTAETPLGAMPSASVFWHLHEFPSRAAAESARGRHGTVVESFGKHLLFTIAEESWQLTKGNKVAAVGPLGVEVGTSYTAHYMEAVFPPGAQTASRDMPGHRHPGPEAWYVFSGAQCLETPNGLIQASAGQTMMVPEGWPMAISSVGTETRRTVLLILHRSSEPYSMAIDDARSPGAPHSHWKPQGLCPPQ